MTLHEPVERLLERLSGQSIRVWVDGDRLRCSGPPGALTADVAGLLRTRKADILTFLAQAGTEAARTITPRGELSPPLSFAQLRLWFIDQMQPDAVSHHITFAVDAAGMLDLEALERALGMVAMRHSALRMRLHTEAGAPRLSVSAEGFIPLRVATRSELPADGAPEPLIRSEARRPFDLANAPPVRVVVIPLAEEHHVILFTLHHICADGWSMDVLMRDLASFYLAAVSGEAGETAPLSVQYGDFAAWQHEHLTGEALDGLVSFWTQHLAGPLPVTVLPADFVRSQEQKGEGDLFGFELDADLVAGLRRVAATRGATLFATLFTAFNILIGRHGGQSDLVIGTPVANRRFRETEDVVGLFVNPLPVRTRLSPSAGFAENLARVQETLWNVLEHQDLPFERIVEAVRPERDAGRHPLFQIRFQMEPESRSSIAVPGLEFRRRPCHDGVARLDLGLELRETGQTIKGSFEFDCSLFRKETIRALAGRFRLLLAAIVEHPDRAIASLPLLSAAEYGTQIIGWNGTDRPFDGALAFHQVFEARAAETPDAIALVFAQGEQTQTLTYEALNRRANRLAHLLRGRGAGPESIVGIALERGFDMIAAWLAVQKAGGAWLPLDPAYPAARLAYMLADSGPSLVLTQSAMELPAGIGRIDLDTGWPDAPEDNLPPLGLPENLAYIIYTSGSTGRPKGVLVERRGLLNLTEDKIRTCKVGPGDCVLQFFSFSFDASIPELVMSLGSGARLLLLSAADVLPGPELGRLMRRCEVSHITMTPSALLALPAGDYPALRMVLVGGEVPSPELIARWGRSRLFINAYGPTETTVNASMVACGNGHPDDATLWPAANKQLYVLDVNMEPVPPGISGELHIGGTGIARGYHGRAALSAERFVPDPFAPAGGVLYRSGDLAVQLPDGRIRVLGRIDDQVKIRGYRIEPGEIETALLDHPDIATATVAIRDIGTGGKRIFAYGVARNDEKAAPPAIRTWLAERLPRFMVPDAFMWLDTLPLTVNGKVDMRALPMPEDTGQGSGRALQTPVEQTIAAIFSGLLGVGPVTASADFFDLGGHSLLATRLSAIARESHGLDISVSDIFTAPSVEGLAALVESRAGGKPGGDPGTGHDALLQRDIRLDNHIRPAVPVAPVLPPRHVFLTGATGFLGAYLLHELLREPGRHVWCLVRGASGEARLRAALERYGLPLDGIGQRLHAVHGDLASAGLGIENPVRDDLLTRMDAIVHNGAEVHHLYTYERLRAANVEGMKRVLELACAGAGRPFHHISSLSALAPVEGGAAITENDAIAGFAPPDGGYNRSKWVAEHLADEAKRRGLPVSIYRPGAISGDSRSGMFNEADILCRLMQGYLRCGMAPEGDMPVEMLPVDYAARAIVNLLDMPEATGGTFHLINSQPVSSALIFEACALEGLDIRRVPRVIWLDTLRRIVREEPDHPLYPLAGLFEKALAAGGEAMVRKGGRTFDCTRTRAALANAPCIEPRLDVALFRTYVRAFRAAGALETIDDRQARS